jgi:predicted SAM-dependent methyltransferase
MANIHLRSVVSKMLPDSIRDRVRPIGHKVLGLMNSGRIARSIKNCRDNNQPLRIIVGAGSDLYDGWIATDKYVLDICSPESWSLRFERDTIDAMLSEHVLEHLSLDENRIALSSAFRYLKSGGRFRIAVPDGNRRDPVYRADVAPPADGHKMLFHLKSLSALLEDTGFIVNPLEYFDDDGKFHAVDWKSEDGHIRRSVRYDRQVNFRRGDLFFTSLVVDAVKPDRALPNTGPQ